MDRPAGVGAPGDATDRVAPGAVSALLAEVARAPAIAGAAWDVSLRPGAAIGRYELVREIGRGGFGVVWEAVDTSSGRPVAFKAVRAGRRAAPREARLLEEAEIAARLSHPNIVALLDAGRSENGPYLVLELLRGRTLADRLGSGALSPAEALEVGAHVARALAHAHGRGVVHRDLKPENVFLCRGGGVKVLDFGLAHAFGRRRVDGGTPLYMAPEQRRGAPEDERTDVFALGVMLFRMLANELPFPEGGEAGRAAPALEVAGAPEVGPLVGRMLEIDPVARPRDAAEVVGTLERASSAAARDAPGAVAVRIRRRPGGPATSPTADVRAHEYCLRGRQFIRQTRKASLEFACELFRRATEVDPRHALAHAGLAEAAALIAMHYPPDEASVALADAESAKALALGPDSAEAHAARGLALFLSRRGDEASRELERAIALDAGLFEPYYYQARVCFQEGRMEQAARLFLEATRVREDCQASFFAAQSIEALGRRDEALELYRAALEVVERHMDLNPDDPRAATMRAVALCRLGKREEGLRWAERALAIDPRDAGVRYNVACFYALEGAVEPALRALEEVVRAGFGNRDWIRRDPDLDSLRGDPRFQALLRGQ
ncbi:MAG TPA: serine/threonine-protein kinase [Anaeromyxobacteraceae bacterium]|nr:serine/threonine-protein kinase [Anaeromyxobacteraceae bacterium]